MNYYAFHIGDYSSATMHLSWDEDLAYRRLIDVYYMRESALPADRKQVYRLVRAASAAQRKAVDTVLNEFFVLLDSGFTNTRCEDELVTVADKSRKAKSSAEARWRNANASENAMRTHSEGNAPNPNPNPNPKEEVVVLSSAREVSHETIHQPTDDLEKELREAAGWQSHPSPNLFVTGQIAELIQHGASLDHDVIPIIRRDAPRCRSPNWNYFTKAIAQARADREAASKLNPEANPNAPNHKSRNTLANSFAIVNAAIAEAERREAADSLTEYPENVEAVPRLRQGTA